MVNLLIASGLYTIGTTRDKITLSTTIPVKLLFCAILYTLFYKVQSIKANLDL